MSQHSHKIKIHDTHAHLDMMLEKMNLVNFQEIENSLDLEFWQELEKNEIFLFNKLGLSKSKIENFLQEFLSNHEFLIQSTTDTFNFLKTKIFLTKFQLPVYYALGSHPEIVKEDFNLDEYLWLQKRILNNLFFVLNNCIAIGEIGLDYYYTKDFKIKQMQWNLFSKQLELATDLDLPVIVHCREAFDDLFAILQDYPEIENKILVHCFTGSAKDLEKCLEFGIKIGINGIITFGKSAENLRQVIVSCPDDSFVLESDLPFLSPSPERGSICTPEKINYTAEKLAKLKNYSVEKIWQISKKNSIQLFDLDLV